MSFHSIIVTERPFPGLAVVVFDGDSALWTRVKLRKDTRCAISRIPLPKGSEAYRPVGNQMYRMERIHPDVIEHVS